MSRCGAPGLWGCGLVSLLLCLPVCSKRPPNLLRPYIQRLVRLRFNQCAPPLNICTLQKHGIHVIVVPGEARPARVTACDAVILPASTLRACLAPNPGGKHRDDPAVVAALQYVLAHEVAHIYLNHAVSNCASI